MWLSRSVCLGIQITQQPFQIALASLGLRAGLQAATNQLFGGGKRKQICPGFMFAVQA